MSYAERVAFAVAKIMKARKVSVDDLAEEIARDGHNLTRSVVYHWFRANGKSKIRLDYLPGIARALRYPSVHALLRQVK